MAKLAASVWLALTFVNAKLVTAPTELPSTSTSATWKWRSGVIVMVRFPPGATVCAPEGDTVPFAPADPLIVNPALQEPEGRHKGFAGSLLPHCASVVQAAHEFVAWLQIGVEPAHWLSAVHAKQAPDASQKGCDAFLLLHCALVAHATHEWVDESQIGAMPVHWESAVHWLVRSKLAAVGASGVEAVTAYSPEIELAVALRLAIPDAFVVAVMHPAAAGTQAEPPLSVAVAPLAGAWNVTTTPATAAPVPSRTSACSCEPKAAPTVADCGLPAWTWIVWPPSFVSVNVAGVETPDTLAVTVKTPPVAFAVAVTLASPELSVTAVAAESVAVAPLEPVCAAKFTVMPGSELPEASATTTTKGLAKALPVGVVCGFPLTMNTAAGPVETFCRWKVAGVATPETDAVTVKAPTVPLAVAVTLDMPEESVVALTLAPLELPFETVQDAPEAGTAVYVTVAPGMGLPAASRTTATRGAAYCVLIGASCGSVELPPLT